MTRSVSVLIVDDVPCVRELFREYMQGHGCALADAKCGNQMRARIEAANPNWAPSRDPLLMRMRNREWEPQVRSIGIRIGRLRRKVEPEPEGGPRGIRTVRKVGYMFVPTN
jgi:DNA-binding response OmpR family regulator